MGQEIATSFFSAADFERFSASLREETAQLAQWLAQGRFGGLAHVAGLELEAWLVGRDDLLPAPVNESFLGLLANPLVVYELARFNVEINTTPHPVGSGCLSAMRRELEQTWKDCQVCAQRLGASLVAIGILPTLQESMLSVDNMSPLQRYRAINEQVLHIRHGRPLCLDIQGQDHLVTCHRDVMLEAATTSLQMHLQVPQEQAVRFFNAALIISAPMVAVSANSPYLFGRDLWDDTRIPLFEQSVDVEGFEAPGRGAVRRVTFGTSYARESLFECFQENLDRYPVLLPIVFDAQAPPLSHLRLHNGTIWRWNRPLIGIEPGGAVHLRIEHRVASAGPTVADMIANIALFLGLVYTLGTQQPAPESQMSFDQARANFYAAAKDGLRARVTWLDGREVGLQPLLLDVLLPLARRGLQTAGMRRDIRNYLDQIMESRVQRGRNGAAWQREFVARYGRDMRALTAAYAERQQSGLPVHQWDV